MRRIAILVWLLASAALPVSAASLPKLLTPVLRLPARVGPARVALTFDACDGSVDRRILDALEQNAIPATIFVTGKWLARNAAALAEMQARPDLFEIEDHGARHLPAVDYPTTVFGLRTAGSPEAVTQEITGGAQDIVADGSPAPQWFRGATAEYDASAIAEAQTLGYRIAGFSLNGDDGAMAPERVAAKQIAAAKDGDVIIAHFNQPRHSAGAGVVEGILALKARGVQFVRLDDAFAPNPRRNGPL